MTHSRPPRVRKRVVALFSAEGDAVQSFGVAVAGRFGGGRFVIFGDDALFQNQFLTGNNARLGTNLARWLSQ